MRKLLFVDTNIWLDFYRVRNDAAIKLLDHVEAVKNDVIVTYQVECEFKKNRQAVIFESYNALKIDTNVGRPALFADAQASTHIVKGLERAKKGVAELKNRLSKILENPTQHDKVYQIAQRVFHKNDSLVLTRDNPERRGLRHRARTRFSHGLPPRKKNDTSMGDAFNWEWIVLCAIRENAEVVIVSRDADYGLTFNGKSYVNDHLRHEFSDRVSKKRGLYLYDNLSVALKKHFDVQVTTEEEKAEMEISAPPEPAQRLDWKALLESVSSLKELTQSTKISWNFQDFVERMQAGEEDPRSPREDGQSEE
jgi:PIN domain